MKSCLITGSSGFVGTYLCALLKHSWEIVKYDKSNPKSIEEDVVIHLAGKAHDLKNISNSDEYYLVNTELTKKLFDEFLLSKATVFVYLSSVKAIADFTDFILHEDCIPNPVTHYGKSKLLAEQYISSKTVPAGKRVFILRPCMIHGPGNKGNLNLLYEMMSKGFPWPLGSFQNKRSFCSIDNLCFAICELITNDQIKSDVFNISDDEPLSTNQIIQLIGEKLDRKISILKIPIFLIKLITKFGDIMNLPLNSETLQKLTENFVVSNRKIKVALQKELPFSSLEGIRKTISSL